MSLLQALSLPEGPRRTAAIAAWVQGLFSGEDQAPVLVGGAAVEILTGGAYTTGDLDFVGFVPPPVREILEQNGFKRSGRHWIHEDGEIFLEFPAEALDPKEKAIRHEAFGHDLVLISLEDLLVDRLGGWAHWKSGVDGANAFLLFRICRSEIDENRLTRRAREAGFERALNVLRKFDRVWAESDPDPESLEVWANNGPQGESS
jgi:hypothetical protein